jgi:DNA-binding FadR family transcriptional regulator
VSTSKKELLIGHITEMILAFERSDTDMAFKEFSIFCDWLEQCCLKQPPRAEISEIEKGIDVIAPSAHATAELSKTLTSGAFKVGDVLPEAEDLSKKLRITPAATRAALTKLETLGVIERGKKERAVIRSLTIQETKDPLLEVLVRNQRHLESVVEFRVILEEQTAYLAAQRCTPALLQKLRKRLDILEEKFNLQDEERYAHLDIDFHKAIAALSGNAGLRVITSALVNFFETATARWLSIYHELTGSINVIHEQHIAIYEAIAAQEPIDAMRAMNVHLSYVIKMTRSFNDIEHREDIAVLRDSLRTPQPYANK